MSWTLRIGDQVVPLVGEPEFKPDPIEDRPPPTPAPWSGSISMEVESLDAVLIDGTTEPLYRKDAPETPGPERN